MTATLANKVYDGTTAATTINTRSLSGIVGSDDVSLGTSGTVAAFGSKNVNGYTGINITALSLSGTTAGNYQLSSTSTTASASITARSLTVTATGVNKPYDGNTTATVTLSDNKVSGDTVSDSYTSAGFGDKNVGTGKTVSVSGISISGGDAGNYNLGNTTASTTANITALALTVTADAKSKTYGDADPALTSQVTSGALVAGDSLSGSLTRVAGENAGTYPIQQGTLSAGGNYALAYTGANLTITLKPLLAQADDKSRGYGQTNPVFTVTYTGFVPSDSVTNLAVLPTASTTADTNSPVGTYDITLTGGSDTNYSLVLSNGA